MLCCCLLDSLALMGTASFCGGVRRKRLPPKVNDFLYVFGQFASLGLVYSRISFSLLK